MKKQSQMGLITQTELIKKHGWTKRMIEEYLPEPIIYSERFYSGDMGNHYMKLYNIADVCKAYQDTEFLKRISRNNLNYIKKYYATNKSVKTNSKREDLINHVMFNIGVVYIEQSILDQLAYNYVQEWVKEHPKSAHLVDVNNPTLLTKAAFQYIMKNLTTSNDDYRILNNCYCTEKEFLAYRRALNLKIAKVYPKYTKLCNTLCNKELKYTESEEVINE